MRLYFFILGLGITCLVSLFSYYPVFQDFNETDYVIPFYKYDDYPTYTDLLIVNVHQNCGLKDNIFSQYSIEGEPMCDIAQNWFNVLLVAILGGIILMMVSAALPPKIKT